MFEAAVALDGAARTAHLDAACRDDDALRAAVEALLDADDAADATDGGFLDAPPLGHRAAPEPALEPGAVLGPYRVRERIGEGGMGEVFLAERADGGWEQTVALKLVKRGMDTDAVLRRFRVERRILARLEHPGIARLLDGGAAPDGRPWLAMEYVRGEPLTAYATRHALGLDARLALFEGVVEAVRHAHARLVVHRDLKPGNVLVAEDEAGRPHVKLLDFGIARLLDGDATDGEASLLTGEGVRPMTRAYAAPEQLLGEPVTTATDVYALGALLYELLTGHRPFEAASASALEAAVLRGSPARPSAALRPTDRAAARRLRGDLDTLCLRALSREPEARYASADALLADVRRYRAGLPLAARAPGVRYRLRTFVRRHPAGVAMAVAAVLTVAVAVTYHTHRLSVERDQARRAAAEAEQVSATLVGLFGRDPLAVDAARVDTLTVRQFLLSRGAETIDRLRDQPALQARLLPLFSRLHVQLGDYPEARALAARALRLDSALGLGNTAEAAEAHTALATALENMGELEPAEAHYRRALALHRTLHGDTAVATAEATNNLAVLLSGYEDEASRREALRLGLIALEAYRRRLGPDHLDVAQAHNNVGATYFFLEDYDRAATHYRRALDLRRRRLGDHPLVANTESNLANLLHDQGRFSEAVPLFQDAIRIWRTTLRPDHPLVSTGLYGLAKSLRDLGRLAEAEQAATESLSIDRASLPLDHPYLADGLLGLAEIHTRQGRLSVAEADYRAALAIYDRRPETSDADRATAQAGLGTCLLNQGRPSDAAPLLRTALPHLDAEAATAARAALTRATGSDG